MIERPFPGLVEMDAAALANAVLEVARASAAEAGDVEAVGVTNQRGTTVVWDAATGEPVGPALSWQDLRTAGTCLELQAEGLRLAPNEAATKLAWLLDTFDPSRQRDLRFGTLDTWVVWALSQGSAHVTDFTNAAVSGLLPTEAVLAGTAPLEWDPSRLERFRIPASCLPQLVSSSVLWPKLQSCPAHHPCAAWQATNKRPLLAKAPCMPAMPKPPSALGPSST